MTDKPTFPVGRRVKIDSARCGETTGEILAIRHAVGNHNTGALSIGADVLLPDGRTHFYFLHDIARWNAEIKEFCVTWCACPHIHNTSRVLFIRAGSADDAKAIAEDHIRRQFGISWFTIFQAVEAKPVPAGHVLSRDGADSQKLTSRELATVLAALRYWQHEGQSAPSEIWEIANDGLVLDALDNAEIDALCVRINR